MGWWEDMYEKEMISNKLTGMKLKRSPKTEISEVPFNLCGSC